MKFTRDLWVGTLLGCVLMAIGCGGSGGGSGLTALLPKAPAGWQVEQAAHGEDVSGAGSRAWAAYKPVDGSQVIQKLEITISRLAEGAGKDRWEKLRRVPNTSAFMEQVTVKDLPARRSLPIGEHHVVFVSVDDRTRLDLVIFNRKAPSDKMTEDADIKGKAADLFLDQLDWAKIKALKSAK